MDESRKATIIGTLSCLIEAMIEDRRKRRSEDGAERLDIMAFNSYLDRPPEHSIVTRPIDYSLRLGIKHLGQVLNASGGYDLMQEVSCRVEDLPQFENSTIPGVILNSAWDGIGNWYA